MKIRNVFRLMFSGMLLLLVAGPGLARGREPTRISEALAVSADPAANAPWFKIEVDTRGNTGQHVALAIDPYTGLPYISYYGTQYKDLYVAHYFGSGGNCGPNESWLCHTVDSDGDVGKYSSIAAVLNSIFVSYYSNGDLKYAESIDYPGHYAWTTRTIDTGILPSSTGLFTSVEFYSGWGTPRITYHLNDPNNDDELKLATYVGGSGNCGHGADLEEWRCRTIQSGEGIGQHTSLAIDENGYKHIAYYDAGNGWLQYATDTSGSNCGPGGSWTCYPVSSAAEVGKYASMYVDDGGYFHIAYYDATNEVLKYAVEVDSGGNCGILGSAQCETIDTMQADYHPLGISIAEDAAGYPMIAYQSEAGSLNVARPLAALGLPAGSGNCGPENLFSTWYCETIDRYGTWIHYRNGDYISLAVSPSGLATIAYQGFITSSGGNMMVAYQRFQVFLPSVMGD
ncbi:MAG: hypothetical protein PVG14_10435 [Anaerolineales bacterium]|jgi:hypothetical protein